jgi:hypothetical protein
MRWYSPERMASWDPKWFDLARRRPSIGQTVQTALLLTFPVTASLNHNRASSVNLRDQGGSICRSAVPDANLNIADNSSRCRI